MRSPRWIPAAATLALLAALPAAELPRKAPEFAINMTDGKSLPLSQYKGKVVVLAFIETFCTHCQATVGILNRLQTEYGPRGLQILASAIEPTAQKSVPLFVKNFAVTFPVGFNTHDAAGGFIQPTGKLPLMPLMAFIDRQGIIRDQHEGEEPYFDNLEQNLRKEIEGMLKPAAAPPRKK